MRNSSMVLVLLSMGRCNANLQLISHDLMVSLTILTSEPILMSHLRRETQKITLCSSVTCGSVKIQYGMISESNSENGSEPIIDFINLRK